MYTSGSEQVIQAIRPGTRPSGRVAFPADLSEGGARRARSEPAHVWLKRCVDAHWAGDVGRVAVEDNLALFLVVRWAERKITYANIQALWTEAPLERFLAGDGSDSHEYLRLDYDPTSLGPLLKEPLPHVHVEADGEPRFGIPVSCANDVVGWFLDFVYRNFFYDDWVFWAQLSWEDWCQARARPNPWPRLVEGFNQSAVGVLQEQHAADLRDLKRCLAQEREKFFSLRAEADRCDLFSHEGFGRP